MLVIIQPEQMHVHEHVQKQPFSQRTYVQAVTSFCQLVTQTLPQNYLTISNHGVLQNVLDCLTQEAWPCALSWAVDLREDENAFWRLVRRAGLTLVGSLLHVLLPSLAKPMADVT